MAVETASERLMGNMVKQLLAKTQILFSGRISLSTVLSGIQIYLLGGSFSFSLFCLATPAVGVGEQAEIEPYTLLSKFVNSARLKVEEFFLSLEPYKTLSIIVLF